MDVLDGGWYKLGCSSGMIDTHYRLLTWKRLTQSISIANWTIFQKRLFHWERRLRCKAREMKVPVIETVTISVQQKDVLVKVNIIVVTQTVIPQITIALIIRNLQLNSKIINGWLLFVRIRVLLEWTLVSIVCYVYHCDKEIFCKSSHFLQFEMGQPVSGSRNGSTIFDPFSERVKTGNGS